MNKKIILPFFLIFTLFVCMNNVNAQDLGTFTYTYKMNFYDLKSHIENDSEALSRYTKLKDKLNEACPSKYGQDYSYYINYEESNKSFEGHCWNKNNSKIEALFQVLKLGSQFQFQFAFFNPKNSNSYSDKYSIYGDKINSDWEDMAIPVAPYLSSEFNDKDIYLEANFGIVYNSIGPNGEPDQYFDTFQYFELNGITYKNGDLFIKDNGIVVPVSLPKLKYEELAHELDKNDIYLSKRMKFYFSEFDLEKYEYQYSFDLERYDKLDKNELIVDFKMNGIIYFKILDRDGNVLKEYSYEINDIGERKFGDPSLDISNSKFPNFGDVDKDTALEEESSLGSLIQWFYNNITDKFKIILQIKEIYDSWSRWNPKYDKNVCYDQWPRLNESGWLIFGEDFCTPRLTFDLKIPGRLGTTKITILDFRIVERIRTIAFDYLRILMYFYTFLKCIKIIQHNFSGGGE